MKKITLTAEDMQLIRVDATNKRSSSSVKGLKGMQKNAPKKYCKDELFNIELNSTAAECAVARAYDLPWTGSTDTFKGPDIKPNIQVRSSERHDRRLIVREADPNDHFYILSTGAGSEFIVWGGMFGHEAKQKKWLSNPNNRELSYFVPKEFLRPYKKAQGD